jgi:hypothetical protein
VSELNAQPNRVPLVDKDGRVTREWQVWLEQLNSRVGGTKAPTIKEIDASATAAKDAADAAASTADEAKQTAISAEMLAHFAHSIPRDKGLTVDDLIPIILSLQSSVANLSQEVARLRNLETYSMVTR